MRTGRVYLPSEGFRAAPEPFQGSCACSVGRIDGTPEALDRQDTDPGDRLRPIYERQPLLLGEFERLNPHPIQNIRCRLDLSVGLCPSLSHECQRHMRQGCQVSARPHRSDFGHDRVNLVIQEVQKPLNYHQATSRPSLRQGVGSEEEDRTDFTGRKPVPHTCGVAPHEVALERSLLVAWNTRLCKSPEARVDAVYSIAFPHQAFQRCARAAYPFGCGRVQLHRSTGECHFLYLVEGEIGSVESDHAIAQEKPIQRPAAATVVQRAMETAPVRRFTKRASPPLRTATRSRTKPVKTSATGRTVILIQNDVL